MKKVDIVSPIGSLVLLVLLTISAAKAQDVPVGDDFRVNTYPGATQSAPQVDLGADGRFVIVWNSPFQDGSSSGAFARIFDAGGAVGDEFQVSDVTTGSQFPNDIEVAPDGSFLVVWSSFGGPDDTGDEVRAQRFDSLGGRVGDAFHLPAHRNADQFLGRVVPALDGGFVATWSDELTDSSFHGAEARRFDNADEPIGGSFQVNASTVFRQSIGDIDMDASGRFVIVWRSDHLQLSTYSIFGRRFDRLGAPIGGEFQISEGTSGSSHVAVTAADSGAFAVAWRQSGYAYARRYDSGGDPFGPPFRVDQSAYPGVRTADVAGDAEGNFIVVWEQDFDADGDDRGIFGRRYDALGQAVGDAFVVNSNTVSRQTAPRISSHENGDFVVTWIGLWAANFSRPLARQFRTNGLGDRVFRDNDQDGLQDPDEPGVVGITVSLLDAGLNVVRTTRTRFDGSYNFAVLPPDTDFFIRFEPSADWQFTPANAGADDIDSDADPLSGLSPAVQVAAGVRTVDIDAGLLPVGEIFYDSFGSGDLSAWSAVVGAAP